MIHSYVDTLKSGGVSLGLASLRHDTVTSSSATCHLQSGLDVLNLALVVNFNISFQSAGCRADTTTLPALRQASNVGSKQSGHHNNLKMSKEQTKTF